MTILDQITREAKTLSVKERRQALRLIKSLRVRDAHQSAATLGSSKSKISTGKLHPALRAIAGMWKDRTDLPEDGAVASKMLRRRLMGRSGRA